MAGLGAVAMGGAALYNAFEGSQGRNPSSSNMANTYPNYYPYSQQAQQYGLQNISQLPYVNTGQQTQPLGWQTAQQLYNNPYAGQYQAGANTAGGMGQSAGAGAFGFGQGVSNTWAPNVYNYGTQQAGQAPGMFANANTIMNLGLDPQSALYQRTMQQVQDQTRAAESARGIATTPYGAGIEGQAMSNFNIDWQNQQLQRAIAAGQAYNTLENSGIGALGAGANTITGAANLGAGGYNLQYGGANAFGAGAAAPYNAYGTIGQGQFGALGAYGQLGAQQQPLAMTPTNLYFNYAGLANQSAGTQLAQNQQAFNQGQTMGGNIGWGLYGAGQGWNQGTPGLNRALGYNPGAPTGWGTSMLPP